MRIRKSAARLLGSAPPYPFSCAPPEYDWTPKFEPDPPPPMQLYAGTSVFAAEPGSGEPCYELSRSPWDLLNEPQEEDRLVETYLVQVGRRAGWFAETVVEPRLADEFAKKKRLRTDAVVKEEEGDEMEVKPRKKVWTCKKNDVKLWHCRRPVSSPDSLCEYHQKKRDLSTAAAPTKAVRKKKKSSEFAGEGFYYYTGFAPSSSKRHRRRPTIVKQESSPPVEH